MFSTLLARARSSLPALTPSRIFLAGTLAGLFIASPFVQAAAPVATPEYVTKAAAATGWSEDEVTALLRQAEVQPRILELMDKPAEKAMPWYVYFSRVVSQERIAGGKVFMTTYADTLARAEATYGVPKEIITAIIGVESRYGANRGNFRVLDSLATLSFNYPRRATYFQTELTAFLKLARAGQVDPLTVKGSYAGAIGWGQFMPSNISKLATDFDGDGVIDLYDNPVDAIGSVAKYFSMNGWKTGHSVAAGTTAEASNLKLDGAEGPEYFKVEHNFNVIKRYNHNNLYAMSVFVLSEQLK
jgi:membrane-bound lytic murein transglycosylase B